MTGDDERLQIEQVIVRLIAGHPFVSAGVIEGAVRIEHKRFDECRNRNFVALLVKKACRRDLECESAPGLGCVLATPAATALDSGVVHSIERERVRPEALPVSVTVDPERARADHGR
ncbi:MULTISPECIES: hypothetical protein [unclassified Rhodococcus (in: high G+C Gram-positive bacteria)]|uniref:three-helix bundle dimerization domain-containing protein n=1 Tax=unclassified Rhodococcus (in: high G+C Gram-positive bacteria) TaxID=192944 RepID=UPI001FF9360A|nr:MULTISPECIES: hypothetical protein [unclassified Rhodococcus (in: high G+C Gram-positive bacteria)]